MSRLISLSTVRAALKGMTQGRYSIEPGLRLQGAVNVEILGRQHQVAMMTGDAPSADPDCCHVETQPGRNALGLAVLKNHAAALLEIAEAALAMRTSVRDEESARAQFQAQQRLDAALAKVTP